MQAVVRGRGPAPPGVSDAFYLDKYEVTYAQYRQFMTATGRANAESKLGRPAPVGSSPGGVSPYGVYDLAGNVWEWVADWYEETYYQRALRRNPPGPSTGEKKVLRGGSWSYDPFALRTALRGLSTPDARYNHGLGFRCAKGVP